MRNPARAWEGSIIGSEGRPASAPLRRVVRLVIKNYSHSQPAGFVPVRRSALFRVLSLSAVAAGLVLAGQASADAPIQLSVKNHHFTPSVITAPAGQRFTIQVRNLDPTPEEFESYDFKVEKIIAPNATIIVSVGALKPGAYAFFGDYNPTLAKGVLHVVPAQGH